jgi:hypothetical protein
MVGSGLRLDMLVFRGCRGRSYSMRSAIWSKSASTNRLLKARRSRAGQGLWFRKRWGKTSETPEYRIKIATSVRESILTPSVPWSPHLE